MRSLILAALLPLPLWAEEAPPPTLARPVVTEIVTADPTRQRSFPGVIAAETQTVLAFQTLGRLASLPVSPGDRVKKGDVVATLDQVTLQEDVEAAKAAESAARAQADFARQSLARVRELVRRNVASTAQLEAAQAGADTANAQAAGAAADLARAQDAARFGTLTAPDDGIVLSTMAEVGAVLTAGSPVLTLAARGGREAVIDVPAEFLTLLSANTRFEVRASQGAAVSVPARLRLIEPEAGASLRTRRLRLTMEAAPAEYRLGSLITATLAAGSAPVVTLPAVAVDGTPEKPLVWRVGPADRAVHAVPVTLGKTVGDRVVVTAGVAAGDEIVVRGANSLTEGQVVGAKVE